MIELRDLRSFLTVADEQSFGRAARRLNIGEMPLDEQIRQLEQSLGITLFERDRRRALLTPAGATFVSGARRTLDELERALNEAQRTDTEVHSLRVACSAHAERAVLTALVQRFRGALPHVRVDLSRDAGGDAASLLARQQADIALVTGPCDDAAMANADLRAVVIHRERFHLALPDGHYLLEKRQIPLKALWNENIAFLSSAAAPSLRGLIVAVCRGAGFAPRLIDADDFGAVLACTGENGAIGLVPASFTGERVPGIEFRALTGMTATADIVLLHRHDDESPMTSAFVGVAGSAARQRWVG